MPIFPKRIVNQLILFDFSASLGSAICRRSTFHLRPVNAAPRPRGAHSRPSFAHRGTPHREGRREGRVQAAPMARLQKEKQAAVTTGLAEQPAFPARWVERLLRALPGDRACLPPSSGCRRSRHQRRGVGTTRLDRPLKVVRPHAKRALRPQAATASPAPRSVTIAKRPFSEQETARSIDLICPTTQGRSCPTECGRLARRAVWGWGRCGGQKGSGARLKIRVDKGHQSRMSLSKDCGGLPMTRIKILLSKQSSCYV